MVGFGPSAPPRLAWGAPGAYFDGKMHQKKPSKCALGRRYSARVAGKLRAWRARRGATRHSHSVRIWLWVQSGRARPRQGAPGVLRAFRERSGRGGRLKCGCFTAGACQCVQHGRRQRGQSWVLGGAGPSHLRGWPGEPQGHVSTERCTKKTYWLCPGRAQLRRALWCCSMNALGRGLAGAIGRINLVRMCKKSRCHCGEDRKEEGGRRANRGRGLVR